MSVLFNVNLISVLAWKGFDGRGNASLNGGVAWHGGRQEEGESHGTFNNILTTKLIMKVDNNIPTTKLIIKGDNNILTTKLIMKVVTFALYWVILCLIP